MRMLLMLLLLGAAGLALAAPPQDITLVYRVNHNGQPFADVTETFHQENGHYQLESLTKGIGIYALLGVRRLASTGEVTPEGLRPLHFDHQQGDKIYQADFDWTAGTLTMTGKGKTKTEPLPPGAQDLASYAYQFMFAPPKGDEVSMPVTTGRKLRVYHFRLQQDATPMETPAGSYQALHLSNLAEDGDGKQLWIATDAHYLPVRIMMQDEKNGALEQILTRLRVN